MFPRNNCSPCLFSLFEKWNNCFFQDCVYQVYWNGIQIVLNINLFSPLLYMTTLNLSRIVIKSMQIVDVTISKSLFENYHFFRIFWVMGIMASLFLCINLIHKSYQKWESSPVIVSFATKETAIFNIPFPAVTICLGTKALTKKFDYSKYYRMKKNNVSISTEK